MIINQIRFIGFLLFSLFAINFSTYYVVDFFDINREHIKPLLMFMNVLGFFVIVLPKQKGTIVERLTEIANSSKKIN